MERSIEKFIEEVDVKGNKIGFFNQTIQKICSATTFQQPGCDFWLAEENGEVAGYVLANIVIDIDGSLCYWISQAWSDKRFRNTAFTKESWLKILDHSKRSLCRYLIVVSARKSRSFMRFLGYGAHEYASLIKVNL